MCFFCFMSLLWRIASTAVILVALIDGIHAEIIMVTKAITQAAAIAMGDTQIRIGSG